MWRPAEPADALALAHVWREAWAGANPDAASVAPLAHWLARVHEEFVPPTLTLVHQRPGEAVTGFGVVDVAHAYLHQLHVAPSAQGGGIGGELLRRVNVLCPGGWSLHVATANQRARRFYARQGLVAGSTSLNPTTGRERIRYAWRP